MKRKILKIASKILLWCIVGFLLPAHAFAQSMTVKGVVLDNTGMAIIGANVLVKGTGNGTSTNIDGNFTIKANKGDIIAVSYIGYQPQEQPASELMKFVLHENEELLDEVVVIGYGTVKKTDLTGSITAIKAEDINRGAVTSPDQMLQGKVPGLLVTPAAGDPTGSATIRIRGAASLKAKNDPLIVIDGVPVTAEGGAGMANPLASVNPNDIDTYTVLKDASATAIYGSRASNGVIIITTKKGTGNNVQVSYNSSYSLKQNSSTLDVMTGDQYRDYMRSTYAGTSRLETVESLMGTANTNWQDLIYRTAFTTDQNLSVYGNVKGKFPYRVSMGYTYDEATLKVGDNQRANLSISMTPKFFDDHLSVNINAKGIYNKANYPNSGAVGSAISFTPTQEPYFRNADGSINKDLFNGYWNWNVGGQVSTNYGINPLSQLYDYTNRNDSWRSLGNVQLDYKIHGLEDLRLNLNLGYDVARTDGYKYAALGSVTSARNNMSGRDLYEEYANINSNTLLELYANYNKQFGIHHLDVMAGYSWQHNYVKYDNISFYNANRDEVYLDSPSDRREYYLLSFFGRVNYSIDSKYLFTFSLRDDASSRFSKENRWGLFPSAAFAWNIVEEDFIKDHQTPLSNLKIRLGWGRTGQQDIGMDNCYAYQPRYVISTSPNMMIPGFPGLGDGVDGYAYTISPMAYNKNIKWETTETYNVGVDFGFLNGRISGSVDAYLRHTYDLLNDITTPLGSNFSNTVITNVGDMENKGVEVNLSFVPIETKDLHWDINLNGTWQDTKITKLSNVPTEDYLGVRVGSNLSGTSGYSSLYRVGYAPYTYHLFQQVYDSNGNPIENALVDRNGDGQIAQDDRYVTGKSIMPYFYFGISTQIVYKNWDFGFNAHGSLGGYALNKVAKDNSSGYKDDYTKGYIDNLMPICQKTGWTESLTEFQHFSDMFLEDASFFRMDDINVGYTFDKIKNWKGKIRIGASVQNVFVITKYSGLDPEVSTKKTALTPNFDYSAYARNRIFTGGVKIVF